MPEYLIVGGGVAGAIAAQSILLSDPAAKVTLVGEEPYPYYYRPKLWEFLTGRLDLPALYFRPLEWYASQKIQLRLNVKATAIHPQEHQVILSSGESIPYDRLLLATGASPFLPTLPGIGLAGVFALRTLNDTKAIRYFAAHCRRAVVVGGGLLGLEAAHALSSLGLGVTVVEMAPNLLPRQLDREGAWFLQTFLQSKGLRIFTGVQPSVVLGEATVAGIRLIDGQDVAGELVLFSAGIVPRTELAASAGLEIQRGITVDSYLQTSAADIFAAGDAAEFQGRTYGLIPPAIEQARVAARNMTADRAIVYPGTLPSATLSVAGMEITSIGEATSDEKTLDILRQSDPASNVYRKLVLRDGVLVGAILINDPHAVLSIKQLIASRRNLSAVRDRLLDPTFDLSVLAKEQPSAE
jgi:nitrite reductase (NADH) large subunit